MVFLFLGCWYLGGWHLWQISFYWKRFIPNRVGDRGHWLILTSWTVAPFSVDIMCSFKRFCCLHKPLIMCRFVFLDTFRNFHQLMPATDIFSFFEKADFFLVALRLSALCICPPFFLTFTLSNLNKNLSASSISY